MTLREASNRKRTANLQTKDRDATWARNRPAPGPSYQHGGPRFSELHAFFEYRAGLGNPAAG